MQAVDFSVMLSPYLAIRSQRVPVAHGVHGVGDEGEMLLSM